MESNGFTGTLWNVDEHLCGGRTSTRSHARTHGTNISCSPASLSQFPVEDKTHAHTRTLEAGCRHAQLKSGDVFAPERIISAPKHLQLQRRICIMPQCQWYFSSSMASNMRPRQNSSSCSSTRAGNILFFSHILKWKLSPKSNRTTWIYFIFSFIWSL